MKIRFQLYCKRRLLIDNPIIKLKTVNCRFGFNSETVATTRLDNRMKLFVNFKDENIYKGEAPTTK